MTTGSDNTYLVLTGCNETSIYQHCEVASIHDKFRYSIYEHLNWRQTISANRKYTIMSHVIEQYHSHSNRQFRDKTSWHSRHHAEETK